MTMFVMPYKMASESAKALAEALNIKRVNKDNTRIKGNPNKILVNWGNTTLQHPELLKCTILNKPDAVAQTCNKLKFFQMFQTEGQKAIIPEWTDRNRVAIDWITENKDIWVVARKVLTGHSGEGIQLFDYDYAVDEGIPAAPLYTKYIPKKDEYRIHFSRKTGIFFKQRKALVRGTEKPDFKIRNLAGGFIYANQDIETPEVVDKVAEVFYNGMEAGGLDFGALDIIYNERQDKAYILEVNTAPGLSGRTLEAYKDMLKVYLS
jgi:glutathione synthase/RimK-type ligase-like ATP-grasp enzyme